MPGTSSATDGQTVLAEINQIDPIYAYFTINERDLLRIRAERAKAGQSGPPTDQVLELGVANEDGFPHQGKLDFAAISLTPTTGTLELRGIFPNPDYKLLPGPVRPHPRPARRAPRRPARAPDRDRPRPGRRLCPDRGGRGCRPAHRRRSSARRWAPCRWSRAA